MTAPGDEPPKHETYLKYLDKEMAIMGILSAFTAVAPGVALDRTLGAAPGSKGEQLWAAASTPILIGSLSLLLGAAFFYRQRSKLAYYYGQIALSLTPSAYDGADDYSTKQFVHQADLWTSWSHYFTGFFLTTYAFVAYGIAVGLGGGWLPRASAPRALIGSALGFVAAYVLHRLAMSRYSDEYDPWQKAWQEFRGRMRPSADKPKSVGLAGGGR